MPLSGEAAAFGAVGPGAKAYFDYVNSKGGVNGRTIEYRFYDDAYNPAQAVQQTRRLVEQDGVFAIFNAIGTGSNLAIRDYLNAQKVPQLFAGDGSQALGGGSARYPWTVGFYRLPAARAVRADVVQTAPKAKVAVLLEASELGRDAARGLSGAIARKGPRIVASQPYETTATDVTSQIARLKASGADTLMLFATPVPDPGDRRDAEARVAAAALPRVGVDRADDHGDRPRERPAAHPRRTRDRVRQEPERPRLAQGPGRRPLQVDPEPLRAGRQGDRRLPLVRDGRRVDDGRRAQARGRARRAQASSRPPAA